MNNGNVTGITNKERLLQKHILVWKAVITTIPPSTLAIASRLHSNIHQPFVRTFGFGNYRYLQVSNFGTPVRYAPGT